MVSGPCLVSIPTVQKISFFICLLRKERDREKKQGGKYIGQKNKKNKNNARQAAVTMPSL